MGAELRPSEPEGEILESSSRAPNPLQPALLADASWYGTLAAVRDLGSRGVPVTVAADELFAPARWSRYATRTVACPPTKDADRFLEWLLRFGERNPGHVLYPTSDDLAYLIAAHRRSLEPLYRFYSPTLESLFRLLDKSQLTAAAKAAGLDCPETWSPQDEAEVERLSREVSFPLLVKPRAQVLSRLGNKGVRVDRREDLVAAWRHVRDRSSFRREVLSRVPHLDRPLVQTCHTVSELVYTVDGFVDASGEVVGALACSKLIQLPRRSGPGLCFEEAPLDEAVLAGVAKLCRETGFAGVFDAEFAIGDERKLLIDFNPRFYNHMAFEIDRGLPLPWLAYLAALGDEEALKRAVRTAREPSRDEARVYMHRLPTTLMLLLQRLTGAMPPHERRRWREWMAEHEGHLTDPAVADGDRLPGLVDYGLHLIRFVRHPRTFFRDFALNGLQAASVKR